MSTNYQAPYVTEEAEEENEEGGGVKLEATVPDTQHPTYRSPYVSDEIEDDQEDGGVSTEDTVLDPQQDLSVPMFPFPMTIPGHQSAASENAVVLEEEPREPFFAIRIKPFSVAFGSRIMTWKTIRIQAKDDRDPLFANYANPFYIVFKSGANISPNLGKPKFHDRFLDIPKYRSGRFSLPIEWPKSEITAVKDYVFARNPGGGFFIGIGKILCCYGLAVAVFMALINFFAWLAEEL